MLLLLFLTLQASRISSLGAVHVVLAFLLLLVSLLLLASIQLLAFLLLLTSLLMMVSLSLLAFMLLLPFLLLLMTNAMLFAGFPVVAEAPALA
jgi:hypothetical protein